MEPISFLLPDSCSLTVIDPAAQLLKRCIISLNWEMASFVASFSFHPTIPASLLREMSFVTLYSSSFFLAAFILQLNHTYRM